MSKLYKSKAMRRLMRVMSTLGLIVCLFLMAIAVFKIQPLYGKLELLTTQILFIALSTWLMSQLLNNLTMMDLAQKIDEEDKEV